MLQNPYTKEQILKIIKAGNKVKFVESFKDSQKYYDQKIYAIEADSVALQELINEGRFPVDERILRLQEGIYHIVGISSKEIEIKSSTRTENIAFALYKKESDIEFWNKVYQIRINPLFNFISEIGFNYKYELADLLGKSIYIQSINLVEDAKSYKVRWGVCGDFIRYDQETIDLVELHESYLYEMSDEGLFEKYLEKIEDEYYSEKEIEEYLDQIIEEQELEKQFQKFLDAEEDAYLEEVELNKYLIQMEDEAFSSENEQLDDFIEDLD